MGGPGSGRKRAPKPKPSAAAPAASAGGKKKNKKTKKHKQSNGMLTAELKKSFNWLPPRVSRILPMTMECQLFCGNTGSGGTSSKDVFGQEFVFRLGSIFQPCFAPSGAGAQRVLGYTSIANEYTRYKVNAVDVEVEFTDPTHDGIMVGVGMFQPNDGQTLAGNSIMQSDVKQGVWTCSLNNTGSQRKAFKEYATIGKLAGIDKIQARIDDNLYSANIGANPTLAPWLRIAVAPISANLTAADGCTAIVRIKYYVTLMDRLSDAAPTYTVA